MDNFSPTRQRWLFPLTFGVGYVAIVVAFTWSVTGQIVASLLVPVTAAVATYFTVGPAFRQRSALLGAVASMVLGPMAIFVVNAIFTNLSGPTLMSIAGGLGVFAGAGLGVRFDVLGRTDTSEPPSSSSNE